jgi:hypothetical protein
VCLDRTGANAIEGLFAHWGCLLLGVGGDSPESRLVSVHHALLVYEKRAIEAAPARFARYRVREETPARNRTERRRESSPKTRRRESQFVTWVRLSASSASFGDSQHSTADRRSEAPPAPMKLPAGKRQQISIETSR